MDTQAILILFGILICANLGFTARLYWYRLKARSTPAPAVAPVVPALTALAAPATGRRVCATCGLTVARYTPQANGTAVCANCQPLKATN